MNVDSIYGKTMGNKIFKNIWGILGLSDTCLKEIVDPAGS